MKRRLVVWKMEMINEKPIGKSNLALYRLIKNKDNNQR
jgi:hypothetical protein